MANDQGPAHWRIYNPLLDALFNPADKSPLKNTLNELILAHSDFVILIPPAFVLHNCTDFSQQQLVDLCYSNEEFVRSHILRTTSASAAHVAPSSNQSLLIYSTMNGKQILLKNKAIFTGKGFKKSVRVRVLSVGHFVPFSPKFPTGSTFSVMYIEASLYGPQPAAETLQKDILNLPPMTKTQNLGITFEDLLRKFPVLSKSMLPSFYTLFHHNNREFLSLRTHKLLHLNEVVRLFDLLVSRASQIVQDSVNAESTDGDHTYNLLHSLSVKNPGVDMNRLVHEYVELNMYDHVWLLLLYQYNDAAPGEQIDNPDSPKTVLTHTLYRDLSCLSLNQLDIPVADPWDLNILHRRVAEAIKIFATLSGPTVTNQRQKIAVIKETVQTLTSDHKNTFTGPVIDADTLIGLLIMVVVHSKVPNLECHLFYIRHFGLSRHIEGQGTQNGEEDWGFMSYILSNIDAVIFHLHDSGNTSGDGHLAEMSQASAKNYKLWLTIQKQDMLGLEKFLDSVEKEYDGKELPRQHVLRSRNINGESCFHLAIRTRNPHIFSLLLHRTEQWIMIEDLIFDKNTLTNQNLLMTALQEKVPEIIAELMDLFLSSTTRQEQLLYLNARDVNGRSVGHYLSYDLAALDRLGDLIDWEAKDLNSHTPLLSLCRSYDHSNYAQLVQRAFRFVRERNPLGFISYEAHTDKSGNTLLHALARAIPESKLLSEPRGLVNVNEMNHKGMTPAALYVRYNRVENLENMFRDPRLLFDLEEPKYNYNLMDYYSFSASKSLSGPNEEFLRMEQHVAEKYFQEYYPVKNAIQVGFFNARYDSTSSDWAINTFHFRLHSEKAVASKYVSLDRLRQFYKLQRNALLMSFFPSDEMFWLNYARGKTTVPICARYKSNRMLEHLSMFFALANFLRPDSRKQLLKLFGRCCRDEFALGLDMINEVSITRESARNAAGEVKLSGLNIQEILYFVEYSISDLSKYKTVLSKLNSQTALAGVRQTDVRNVTDQFFRNIKGLGIKHADEIAESRRTDATYLELQKYVVWIELCADELLAKCKQLTDKCRRWDETYKKIKSLNAELHKYEDLVIPHKPQTLPVSPGDVATHSTTEQGLSRRNTLSLEEFPVDDDDEEESSFFNFGLIDSKKSRYKKLVFAKSEEVQRLLDLNVDIKLGHEELAAEISQFLEYRAGALKFGVRQFTRKSIVLLRNRHYELSKLLCETRKSTGPV